LKRNHFEQHGDTPTAAHAEKKVQQNEQINDGENE